MLAIRTFFAILFDSSAAKTVEQALSGQTTEESETDDAQAAVAAAKSSEPPPPKRSEALTLLAALQREARFVDFAQESLESYSDEQVGAAAREVQRDCQQVLKRMFDICPLLKAEESATVDVPAGFDAGCYRLTGNVSGEPPYKGVLVHHGWKATACQLPTWTGSDEAALTVSPAEVELA